MKALSIKQPWANLIASGQKTIETRLWGTAYRGELLLVSSKSPKIEPAGFALAVAELAECRPMTLSDERDTMCEIYENAVAWVFRNVRPIKPFPVTGKLGVFDVLPAEQLVFQAAPATGFPSNLFPPASDLAKLKG